MSRLARILRRVRVFYSLLALLALPALSAGAAGASDDIAKDSPRWTVLESTSDRVLLEVVIPAPARVPSLTPAPAGAATLVIPGAAAWGAPGEPELPVLGRLVAVPAGARVSGAVVGGSARLLADLDLAPADAGDGAAPVRDASAYARVGWRGPQFGAQATALAGQATLAIAADAGAGAEATKAAVDALPVGALAAIGAPAVMAGQPVVALNVAPVLYDAAARRAAVCERLVIELRFSVGDAKAAAAPGRPLPTSFARLLADAGTLNLPRTVALPGTKALPVAGAEPGLWVAVARNNPTVLAKLQPLLDWRRRQGYSVEVVDADAAGNTNTGIKAALQAIYDDPARPPLEFITMVGDVGGTYGVPTWNETMSGYNGEGDHYYAMLDGGDILADAHVGRLSFSNTNAAQLDIIVAKIVNYESAPPMDNTAWFGRASLIGDPGTSGITTIWVNQWLKTRLEGLGWSQVDTTWSGNFATRMVSTLNPGASVFTYRGYLGMSGINQGHISTLTNGGRLPVALLPTCGTGSFSTDSEARCESWLRAASGGGIAAVGTATIGTHTRYNNAFFLGAWAGLLDGADHRVGAGQTAGKVGLYTNYYVGEPDRAEIWAVWNSLMGDPAVDMWMGVPQALTVTAVDTLPVGATALEVQVLVGAAPVVGALVCALGADGARWRGLVGPTGRVTLGGLPAVAGTLKLTVSGHGLLPHLRNISVGSATAYCGASGASIVDDGTLGSSGNGDGVANPGEVIALLPMLANTGTGAATGVSAVVGGGSPWFVIDDGACAFGDLGAGQSLAAAAPVLGSVAVDAPDGQLVRLVVDATDGARHWLSTLPVTVVAPRLTIATTAFGGPGGSCDPGEGGALTISLANDGGLASSVLTATLATTSPWLAVTDADGTFADIAAGAAGTNAADPFAIYASTECYAGHLAPCTLTLRDGAQVVAVLGFTVQVGTQAPGSPSGPDAYGYYAFDDTDTASGHAPAYDWIELAPYLGGSGADVGLGDFGWEQDATKLVDLPFAFRFYGKDQSQLSICSNGWAAFGASALVSYHNAGLPGAGGTPKALLAPFWDNLQQAGDHRVYHWHDSANHRYVVQWHRLVQCYEGYTQDEQDFELILLDPAFHQTASGEGMILFQYKTVNDTDDRNAYATVGIQSPDGTDGLLYSFWNHAMGGAAPLAAGRAILFMPLGGLLVPQAQAAPASLAASAAPGAQVTRELLVTNAGDAGSTLQVTVAKVDPAILGSGKRAAGDKDGGAGGLPVFTPTSIAGSVFSLATVDYLPGETAWLELTINAVTAGQEWITSIVFDAPPGVVVNISTAFTGGSNAISTDNATGDGARITWSGGGYLNNGQTGTALVNVTFGAGLGSELPFDWEMHGDNYGTPPHDLNGTIMLPVRGPVVRVTAPGPGAVAVLGHPLLVQFLAANGPTAVDIDVQRAEGGPWENVATAVPAASGQWTWPAVTGEPGPFARLRVSDAADAAVADTSGVFAIGRDLGWLLPDATALTVPAGQSVTLSLLLDATGLPEGTHEALLVLAGNGAPVTVPVTFTVTTASAVDGPTLPAALALHGAVPNPFNPRTVIRFAAPAAMTAKLDVYSVDGRLVRRLLDGRVTAGLHDVVWDGRDDAGREAASGVYFHRLEGGGQALTGKMILAR